MTRLPVQFLLLSWPLCPSPASTTGVSSPSPSPAALALSEMTATFANPDELNLRKYFKYSVFFHIACVAAVLSASFFERHGASWGGVGGTLAGTKVNLVSSAGSPMPRESMVTESKAVDPTKSLHKEDHPKPKHPAPKTYAVHSTQFS